MLVRDRTSRAIWIDTLDGGFSAQRASDVARTHLSRRSSPSNNGLPVEDGTIQDQISEILSRIQVYSCRDVYDVISVTESIRESLADTSLRNITRLVVIDSMSSVLTGLLRGTDGAGHATMIHSSRELGRLAVDFGLVVLVTTISVQISLPEEQPPSILATSNSKPGLGSSWRYATDLQLYITRLNPLHTQQLAGLSGGRVANKPDSSLFDDDSDEDYGKTSIEGVNRVSAVRVAEVLKSKRLANGPYLI
ncbi:DNA repair protein rad51d [Mortierella sp. AD094]|nr:DNA repair protein rad51d [Mortierella sp. AD094]